MNLRLAMTWTFGLCGLAAAIWGILPLAILLWILAVVVFHLPI